MKKKPMDKWTDSEVQALLTIYAMEEIQCDFNVPKKNILFFLLVLSDHLNLFNSSPSFSKPSLITSEFWVTKVSYSVDKEAVIKFCTN